jgi:hypothetical protein
MLSIDFNRPIRDAFNTPIPDPRGQPYTMASAAVSLLQALPAANATDAHAAMALLQKIQSAPAVVTLLPPDLAVLKKAVNANASDLPAIVLSTLAKAAGFVGSNTK